MSNKLNIVNRSWLVLVVSAAILIITTTVLLFCLSQGKTIPTDTTDRFITSTQLVVQTIYYLAALGLVAWLAHLLHLQWIKEREYLHIEQMERLANEDRKTVRNATQVSTPIDKMQLAQELLKTINTLKENKLLKKDQLIALQEQVTDWLGQDLGKTLLEKTEVKTELQSKTPTQNKTKANGK